MNVTIHCFGDIAVGTEHVRFTSPDMNGSCDPFPASSTTIIDLGIWATGLFTPWEYSDYDCSGGLNTVVDLGVWAGSI